MFVKIRHYQQTHSIHSHNMMIVRNFSAALLAFDSFQPSREIPIDQALRFDYVGPKELA